MKLTSLKKLNFASIAKFWERNGFYAVMGLCALTVGMTAFLTREKEVPPAPTLPPSYKVSSNPVSMSTPTPAPVIASMGTAEPVSIVWPVDGDVLAGYDNETPVYNETLGHYSVHPAVDIAGREGEAVSACMDGTVVSVENTVMDGCVIVIDHGGGLMSCYKSLAAAGFVKAGDPVAKGQTISCIGTSLSEAHLGAHVHFEMTSGGEPVDPGIYAR